MASFFLDGSMIERKVQRTVDHRLEDREDVSCGTCVLEFRGRRHVVRVGNLSPSGAMLSFPMIPNIGENVTLHLLDRGRLSAQVRWVRDGRIGLLFAATAA